MRYLHSRAVARAKSMQVALSDLKLEHLWIVYPGGKNGSADIRHHAIAVEPAGNIGEKEMATLTEGRGPAQRFLVKFHWEGNANASMAFVCAARGSRITSCARK